MIAASRDVGYIHEPMNPTHRPGICAASTSRYFLNVQDDDPERWAAALRNTVAFRYDVKAELQEVRTPKDVARMARDAATFLWHRIRRRRALLKDPIALFSAEWIARTLNAQVLVLIRHPAAFISSLKRLGWVFPFEDLATQPQLMEERLAPFASRIHQAAHRPEEGDIIERGSLLWCIFAHVIDMYRQRHDDWVFVRHEDLACSPLESFQYIFDRFDLHFTSRVRAIIRAHCNPKNPSEVDQQVTHELHRDSKRVTQTWRSRLSDAEVQRIRRNVEEWADLFYTSASW